MMKSPCLLSDEIPAKAGTQYAAADDVRRSAKCVLRDYWIPAFAGISISR